MVAFSPCKINIGLDIVAKRPDGYHDIVTAMVPVPWYDVIEIVPSESLRLTVLGRTVDCPPEKNLVMKAYHAVASRCKVPPVHIILQKIIPDGAGLGGGSADAATVILTLNRMFDLGLSCSDMAQTAAQIGADCPFFIHRRSMLCSGIGDVMTPVDLDLEGCYLVIGKPIGSVSTKEAYASVTPGYPATPLPELLLLPMDQWQGRIKNDFEPGISRILPQVAELHRELAAHGAAYVSMSGSGSSVYGIFRNEAAAHCAADSMRDCLTFVAPLSNELTD